MENKDKKIFWERLQTFVKEVQVNDPCSEDEQEMILRVCEIQLSMIKQMKKSNVVSGKPTSKKHIA